MPRTQPQAIEFNTFVKGIVTEAGPLTFPENASLDEQNFVLNRDGSRQRRFGIDFEEDFVKIDSEFNLENDVAIQSYQWTNAANRGDLDIVVVQVGTDIWFFDGNAESISSSPLNSGNPLTVSVDPSYELSFAALYGKLVISRGTEDFLVATYLPSSDFVSLSARRLEMRDLFGIHEDIPLDERPVNLTEAHEYNLYNQGWPTEAACATDDEGVEAVNANPITYVKDNGDRFQTGPGAVHPSNSDIFWLYKLTQAGQSDGVGAFSPWIMNTVRLGDTQATQGAIILDVFDRGSSRSAHPNIGSVPQDESRGFISSIAAYAGRVFYAIKEEQVIGADDNTPNLSTMVFYSQVGNSIDQLSKCYGFNNPTAEDINDPLDTDGGFVTIPEAGEILKLVALGDSLFVIATNGVWEIHGGESSFSATNQGLSKASNIGAISGASVVQSEDIVSYWAEGGIYQINIDPVSLRGSSVNLTQATVQGLYDGISGPAKTYARGVYDSVSRQIRWLYREGTLPNVRFFDSELVLDLNLQAFYVNRFGINEGDRSPYVAGYVDLASIIFNDNVEDVTVNGVTVTSGGEDVTVTFREVNESIRGSTKYLTVQRNTIDSNYNFTFSSFSNLDFRDWFKTNSDGTDARAYLLTGYLTGGDSQRFKQSTYITNHFRLTEQGFTDDNEDGGLDVLGASSCFLQAQWEWTNSATAGRWGRKFQAYRLPRFYTPTDVNDPFDYGFSVTTSKSKIRGKGKALSLLYETEEGKDCHIYGWALNVTANASV